MARRKKRWMAAARFNGESSFHAPVVLIGPKMADTLAKFADGRGRRSDLARTLATLKVFHETFGHVPADWQTASNVPVPIEILELCGRLLAGRPEWAAAQAKAKRKAAADLHKTWQGKADEIWARSPRRSKAAVALTIDPERSDWVRRVIKK
jgi:hypothetical protein